jgi:hydrogenase maturation protease
MTSQPGVVVVGVGSEYRGDDGVGPAVLGLLSVTVPAGVALVPSDGEPTRLVEAWTGTSTAIVVDAVAGSGRVAGTLYRLDVAAGGEQLPAERGASTHDLGVGSAVALARALDRMPGRLIVHGIEGADFSQGVTLSPAVAARIDDLAAAVLADVRAAVASGSS